MACFQFTAIGIVWQKWSAKVMAIQQWAAAERQVCYSSIQPCQKYAQPLYSSGRKEADPGVAGGCVL